MVRSYWGSDNEIGPGFDGEFVVVLLNRFGIVEGGLRFPAFSIMKTLFPGRVT